MDENLAIALLCGVVSMCLSTLMPCVLKDSKDPLLSKVQKVFNTNREVIIVSSVIVAVTAYLALSLYPIIMPEETASDDAMSQAILMQLLGQKMK
jgi:hypothetical protein